MAAPDETGSNTVKGALLSLGAFAVFATHDVAVKILGATYSPFQIIFFAVLLSFPLLSIMLIRDAEPGTLRPQQPGWMAVRTIALTINGPCAFYAFAVLPLAQAYAILFAMPLLVTIMAIPLLGETVRLHRWMAVIVGLIGVLVVLRPGAGEFSLGHLIAILAAISSALAAVLLRKIGQNERREVILLYPMLANFAVSLCVLPFVYQPMPLADLGLVVVVAAFALVGMSLLIRAYVHADAAIVAPMQYSQILWATAFGLLLFDEVPSVYTVFGAGIIIASGAYIVLREGAAGRASLRPVQLTLGRRAETGTLPHPPLNQPPHDS